MMARSKILSIVCLVLIDMVLTELQLFVHQEVNSFFSVTLGNNVTLPCFSKDNAIAGATICWYKQSLGIKPTLITSYFKYSQHKEFHGEFKNNHRVTLNNTDDKNELVITDVQMSDAAVYHCISRLGTQMDFLESVTVIVKDLNAGVSVCQSSHENTEPGRSVALSCTVHTGTCDGPHRVYWFKKSEESRAGVIYTERGNNDQCERNTDSQTNSCVYNLPILNVSSEDTGTYYCAVASCGQVLFGNGTRLNIKNGVDLVVCLLSGALALTSVLVVLLVLSLFRAGKKYSSLSTGIRHTGRFSTSTAANAERQDLHYAAVSINHPSRRQRSTTKTECVYSGVRQDN